ncbi:MAG: phosphoglycolate phosphatase [Blastomonas fulva]|jgi:phosphoglycolate phosphatase|uniref:phosphoglycolate phosphatase n=1 Tax=Blastomonas fulva TaxID=1550728 RepID=UPI0024E1BCD2|nr:phosphoglycolate phosphatase [Blastomonas fulva]MDK2757905.1 phosphoglycolate phosphatase [Blastomonas fulva]
MTEVWQTKLGAVRTVIFDLDGTLLDSAPDLHAAANRLLADMGRKPLSLDTVAGFVGNGVGTLVRLCLEATGGVCDFDEAVELFHEHYAWAPADLTLVYDGVPELLKHLSGHGFSLGVCTNKPHGFAVTILTKLGLLPFFAEVTGGDSIGRLKPDPAMLLHCMAQLGSDRYSTLYVGDSEVDNETALRAEVPLALFANGYRKTPLADFSTILIFEHHSELMQLSASQRVATL